MNKKTGLITIFLLIAILAVFFSLSFATEPIKKDFTFSDVKKATEQKIIDYSGKTVLWEGTLKELISNEAYFEYLVTLPSGDDIRVLSGNGLQFKNGDYIKIRGFIMIRDGRFSHVVLEEAEIIEKPDKKNYASNISGLIPLNASEEVIFKRILSWILYYNPGISRQNATFIANRIVHYSKTYEADPFLVTAVMSAESAFNIYAISVAGAIGLGQLMPGTAYMLGVNAYDPDQNIAGSVRYLKNMLNLWSWSKSPLTFALASYNAGPGAVKKYGGIPPYRETIDYVNIVITLYYQIRKK